MAAIERNRSDAAVPVFFQIGLRVTDLDVARAELSEALGLEWSEVDEREFDGWPIRVCFSRQGPPFLELIEGPAGSPWDPADGLGLDHLGYWTPDLTRENERLGNAGLELEYDGSAAGGSFAYHRAPRSGLRVEPVDIAGKPGIAARFGLDFALLEPE
jgi:hypothetical protein